MLTDALVGLLGGGLWKPAGTAISRGWKVGRHYLDDAVRLSSTLVDDLVAWGWVFSPFVRPAVATSIGYAAAEYIHDTYFSKSPGNSSQVLPAGSARPGGTRKPYPLPADSKGILSRTGEVLHNPCDPGYVPKRVKGKLMCVPKSSKKSRSR